MLDAHLKHHRVVLETEDGLAAGVRVHLHVGGPPAFDACLGGEGAINLFRRRGDANAMDKIHEHDWLFNTSPARVCKHIHKNFLPPGRRCSARHMISGKLVDSVAGGGALVDGSATGALVGMVPPSTVN